MTALSFRQVRDRLNLSSDDDLLSLIARVPQWTDTGAFVDIHGPGMYGHEYHRDGVPLSLDGDSDRYISEGVRPLRLRMWVAREDFRCARRASDPYSSGEYGRVGWYMDESFGYQVAPDSSDTPPHRIRLLAYGEFRIWGVVLTDDLITFRLAPCDWRQPGVMPLYWQVTRPLPDVLANSVRIWPTGFHILKELLTSSTSDAKQLHDADTSPVDTPPAKRNTTPAETDTAAQDTPYTVDDFAPDKTRPRDAPAKRRALAVLVGHVIRQPVTAVDELPARLEKMRPGGEFQEVINAWLERRSDDERQRVEEIAGVSTDSWPNCTSGGETPEHLTRMIWLCLAKLRGVAAVYDTDVKARANKCCNAYGKYGPFCITHGERCHCNTRECVVTAAKKSIRNWISKLSFRTGES
ncbi:hypothetical protein KX375_21955 [Escherichia coli]|uniref:Uncharacterized protein n=2 Tax=Escherichia coli TaxID=562 RepID=A0AAN3H076_ECOLX|nr:hypothetical protein [Escherichia coli]EEC7726301.1 hypothetical protein [Escherichia coli]EEC8122390.1 hypothetical protein [Escherichia coli]EEC8222386.1 hypothetical protein [Escherichia coli]EED1766655.1 hypothetical protein [Escherichia coli]EEQ4549720.1 hypothetical protein [Escherichia coli]